MKSCYHHLVFTLPRGFTSGEPLRWRRVGGLVLAEVRYGARRRVTEARSHARFVLVLRGALRASDGSAEYPASTLLYLTPNAQQDWMTGASGATVLIVDMTETWLARVREQAPVLTTSVSFRGGLVIHLAQRMYGEFRQRDEVSRIATESLVLGVLAEASRCVVRATRQATAPEWLRRARAFIDTHFAEPLKLSAVAEIVDVHPVHLARTFRRVYGGTVASYVRELRVDFAREQLLSTSAPLGDIALAAGFCDQSHFCRQFKRATGVSPAEFRWQNGTPGLNGAPGL